jgi:predicted GNAT family N-acyltransferase
MIRIRKMRRAELDRIRRFIHEIFPRSVVRVDSSDPVLLAESGGKAVGFVHLVAHHDRMILQGIGVVKSMRGKGVGSLLLERALALLSRSDKPVYLKVKALNHAVVMYARYGFFVKKFGRAHVLVKKPNS